MPSFTPNGARPPVGVVYRSLWSTTSRTEHRTYIFNNLIQQRLLLLKYIIKHESRILFLISF
jgi:hypothetical protein